MDCFRGLPFKVGDLLELKSFHIGYRGAWFPCEIKETGKKGVAVDYIAYPDDDVTWMKKLYHKVPGKSSSRKKVELMLRPQFPPLYSEAEAPDLNSLSEVIVVTNGAWKVGDLVDWLCDGAYWSGTITKFLEDDKVELKSPPLPMGEGMVYEASCKELRPSLGWSPKSGWTVPVPRGKGNNRPCAQLIKPVNQEQNASARRSSEHPLLSPLREKGPDNENTNVAVEGERAEGGLMDVDVKLSCQDGVPEMEEAAETESVELNINIPLNSSKCDSIEASIMDLEELFCRIKWRKTNLNPPAPNSARATHD